MMKKIYQTPSMTIVLLQSCQTLLAGSGEQVTSSGLSGFEGWGGQTNDSETYDVE